jgi:hypothetical protein
MAGEQQRCFFQLSSAGVQCPPAEVTDYDRSPESDRCNQYYAAKGVPADRVPGNRGIQRVDIVSCHFSAGISSMSFEQMFIQEWRGERLTATEIAESS